MNIWTKTRVIFIAVKPYNCLYQSSYLNPSGLSEALRKKGQQRLVTQVYNWGHHSKLR